MRKISTAMQAKSLYIRSTSDDNQRKYKLLPPIAPQSKSQRRSPPAKRRQ